MEKAEKLISERICIFNHKGRFVVETECLKKFINKRGVEYKLEVFGKLYKLHDFTDRMSSEQLYMFFSKKPCLIYQYYYNGAFEPFIPNCLYGSRFDYSRTNKIISVLLECYKGDNHLYEWKTCFLKVLERLGIIGYIPTFEALFDNHEKKSKSFFELMKCRLIDQTNNNFNKK